MGKVLNVQIAMTDAEFAEELVARLNQLIQEPALKRVVAELLQYTTRVSADFAHPYVPTAPGGYEEGRVLGLLGVLNGLCRLPGHLQLSEAYTLNAELALFALQPIEDEDPVSRRNADTIPAAPIQPDEA